MYFSECKSGSRENWCISSSHLMQYNAPLIVLKIENFFSPNFFIERYNKLAISSYIYIYSIEFDQLNDHDDDHFHSIDIV